MASFTTLGFEDPKTKGAMRGANPENFNVILSGHAMREPRRMIYIHTVARKSTNPLTRILFPKLVLKGCQPGERYATCCAIPDPISQTRPDQENGGTRIDEHDGWRAAIDLLNPGNLTVNPFAGDNNPDFYANRNGSNLIALGFWPSLNQEPAEQEIKDAERRRDTNYRWLTREATRLAAVSTKDLNEFLQTYPDTHIAMDALGISATWHTLNVIAVTCPNCGDSIKEGIAFHQSSTGVLCVIDAQRAFKAGAISRERYEELTGEEESGEGDGKPGRKPRTNRMVPVT